MKSFEDILDNLDTLVSEGKLSEESASNIADSFYDRYVTEANAYDKAVDIYKKKGAKFYNQGVALDKLGDEASSASASKKMFDAASKKYAKAGKIATKLGFIGDPRAVHYVNNGNGFGHDQSEIIKGYDPSDTNDSHRNLKATWMKDHGNTGVSPEEKYKAGRYLKIHQMAKESSLEDEINGLGIACEAGLISEDFLPILLEAVDSYLE